MTEKWWREKCSWTSVRAKGPITMKWKVHFPWTTFCLIHCSLLRRWGALKEQRRRHAEKCWWEAGCRAVSWRENVFLITFAVRIGALDGFAGPPVRHAWLNHRAMLEFYVEFFGDRSLATFTVLLQKNTRQKITEKCGGNILADFFAVIFALFFVFLWRRSLEAVLIFEIENLIRAAVRELSPKEMVVQNRKWTAKFELWGFQVF